jgi:hypothetical protein
MTFLKKIKIKKHFSPTYCQLEFIGCWQLLFLQQNKFQVVTVRLSLNFITGHWGYTLDRENRVSCWGEAVVTICIAVSRAVIVGKLSKEQRQREREREREREYEEDRGRTLHGHIGKMRPDWRWTRRPQCAAGSGEESKRERSAEFTPAPHVADPSDK